MTLDRMGACQDAEHPLFVRSLRLYRIDDNDGVDEEITLFVFQMWPDVFVKPNQRWGIEAGFAIVEEAYQ